MNKKILILTAVLFLILVALFAVFLTQKGVKPSNPNVIIPTIQNQNSPSPTTPLSVVSVYPPIGGKNIPLNSELNILFNKDFDVSSVTLKSSPSFSYTLHKVANNLIIAPNSQLQKEVKYQVVINISGLVAPLNLNFETATQDPTGTAPDQQSIQGYENSQLSASPDTFLNGKLTHNEGLFAMLSGGFKTTPAPHYYFIVVMKVLDQNAVKNAVSGWLQSLGMTSVQISSLDITYITQDQENAVTNLKTKLPYYYDAVAVLYNKDTDATTVTISQSNKTAGQQELGAFLQQNGVDQSWINNLTIEYQ